MSLYKTVGRHHREARSAVSTPSHPELSGWAVFQGLGVACGPYLVLLNNDPVVTDGSLDRLRQSR